MNCHKCGNPSISRRDIRCSFCDAELPPLPPPLLFTKDKEKSKPITTPRNIEQVATKTTEIKKEIKEKKRVKDKAQIQHTQAKGRISPRSIETIIKRPIKTKGKSSNEGISPVEMDTLNQLFPANNLDRCRITDTISTKPQPKISIAPENMPIRPLLGIDTTNDTPAVSPGKVTIPKVKPEKSLWEGGHSLLSYTDNEIKKLEQRIITIENRTVPPDLFESVDNLQDAVNKSKTDSIQITQNINQLQRDINTLKTEINQLKGAKTLTDIMKEAKESVVNKSKTDSVFPRIPPVAWSVAASIILIWSIFYVAAHLQWWQFLMLGIIVVIIASLLISKIK